MFNLLFMAGNTGADFVEMALRTVEGVGALLVFLTLFFHAGGAGLQLGLMTFQAYFVLADFQFFRFVFAVQQGPADGVQFGFFTALIGFEFFVLFRGLGLALQMCQLTFEFAADIAQAFEVFLRAAHAVFSFAAAVFVFGDARGFFDIHAQLFWFGFDQA